MSLYNTNLADYGGYDDIVAKLAQSRRDILAAVDALDDAAFTRKPSDDEWSVAEVLEHVALTENSVARTIRALRLVHTAGRPLRQVTPPEGRWHADGRAIAPDFISPKGESTRAAVMQALADARAGLLEQAGEGREFLDRDESFPHPYFGTLNGLGWFRMAAFHEENHINQIHRIIDGYRV